MKQETKDLIEILESGKGLSFRKGDEDVDKKGRMHRLDLYCSNYKVTPRHIEAAFNEACKANGEAFTNTFTDENITFLFNRSRQTGEKNGRISYTEKVMLEISCKISGCYEPVYMARICRDCYEQRGN